MFLIIYLSFQYTKLRSFKYCNTGNCWLKYIPLKINKIRNFTDDNKITRKSKTRNVIKVNKQDNLMKNIFYK